jgi:hypothetical protein
MTLGSVVKGTAGLVGRHWRLALVAVVIVIALWLLLERQPDLAPVLYTVL